MWPSTSRRRSRRRGRRPPCPLGSNWTQHGRDPPKWLRGDLGRRPRVRGGRPVELSFCSGFSPARTRRNCCSSGTGHSTLPMRARLVVPRAPIDPVERGQKHRPRSLLWHQSQSPMAWTMASQPFAVPTQLWRVGVSCHGGQQGFHCETSSFLFKPVSEGGNAGDDGPQMGPGMWPSATVPTTAWRARTVSTR